MDPKQLLEYISPILQAVLTIVIPVMVPFVVSLLRQKAAEMRAYAETHASERVRYALSAASELAVKSAEQILKGESGEDKKEYAMSVAESYLDSLGMHLDLVVLEAAVEKAVAQYFGKPKSGDDFVVPPPAGETADHR